MASVGRVTVFVGMLLILHAGYSSAQHRTFLRLSEQPYAGTVLYNSAVI